MRPRPLAFARQQVFHPRAGAGQPGAHSGGLAVQHAGDLVGGVALDVVQVHGRAQVVGQLAHRVPDVGVARVAHELGDVVSYGIERHGVAVPVRFRQVAAAVDGHAQQPRLEVLGAGELGGVAVQPHEHVLVHVLGIGLRARLAQRQAVHGIAPIGHGARHEGLRAIRLRVVLCGHRSTPLTQAYEWEGAIVSTISEFAESTREPRRDGSAGRASRSSGGLRKARNGKGSGNAARPRAGRGLAGASVARRCYGSGYSTPTMTSVDFTMASAAAPSARPRSSMASFVMEPMMRAPSGVSMVT